MLRKFIAKIRFAYEYGSEIQKQFDREREEKASAEWRERQHQLNLCRKHQQESNHSHHADSNCDYCNALRGKRRPIDHPTPEGEE